MRKKNVYIILAAMILLSAVLGVCWNLRSFVMVDFQFYPRDARQLDLRDQQIGIRHYEKILRRMPSCRVLWNVPFQDGALPWDTKEITLTSLTEEDLEVFSYFPLLETVNGHNCGDYAHLAALQQNLPEVDVQYRVKLGAEDYSCKAEEVKLQDVAVQEVSNLDYLPRLAGVLCSGGEEEAVAALIEYCRERQLTFQLSFGDSRVCLDAKRVTAASVTEEQLELVAFLPDLKLLHLNLPEAPARAIAALQSSRPDLRVTWEQELCGKTVSWAKKEIDLSDACVTSLEELDRQMAYFPEAELVFLGECGLDNDLLAAHREKVRDQYKLVWTVSCGEKLKARTDDLTFMPVRERVYYFNDEEAYNLRYCEDMVCIDIGHMSIHNIDFVEYMPDLEYLILAHTQLQYIEPISSCKKLKFLELDWSPLRDLSPLVGCTALEDLNLGKVYADFTPVGEMTWLKNLWMVECSTASRYQMSQALPNTKIMLNGAATVANGWRNLENYYEMRDLLGMHYMSW